MRIPLTLPQLGLTQTEGSVSEWLKKPGEPVKKDEIVFIVATDKAEMEIESPADGVMGEILVEPGVTVNVGTPLAWLEKEGDVADEPAAAPLSAIAAPEPAEMLQIAVANESAAAVTNGRELRLRTSPRARRVARELGVDLERIQGSGPDGRIIEEDVRSAARSAPKAEVPNKTAPALPAAARRRQIIARRMTESIQTIPAFSVSLEVNAAKLVDLYQSIGPSFAQATGTKLSYTDLLLKCVALALTNSPVLNASWSEEAQIARNSVDVNLAVGTETGVTAPVLRSMETASIQQIAQMRATLANKAKEGRLSLAELENGAGTLSNLGMYRVDSFEGIITPGQSFIVSVGRLASRPWVESDVLTIQPTMHIMLSVDHRLADGVEAAQFLGRIAELIEKPFELVWDRR